MRLSLSWPAVFAIALSASTVLAQSPTPRRWTRVSGGVGVGISNSELGGDGGTMGIPRLLIAGVRLHDFFGVSIESLQWIGTSPDEERDFRLAAVDLFPAYRAGVRGLRLTAGIGTAHVRSHPYAGGHGTMVVSGSTKAWLLGFNYDIRNGIFALTPFAHLTGTRGGGLTFESCQTSYDASGHSSTYCGSGAYDRPASISSYGIAFSIR